MQRERRLTKGETPEAPTKKLVRSLSDGTDFTAEDRHAAFVAGYEQGKAERITAEVEDRARALLHQRSLEALGMARRHAARVGPAWAAMIERAGSSDE